MPKPERKEETNVSADEFVPTPVESILLDIVLPHSIYVKVASKFVLFRPSGDKLTKERVNSLKKKNVDTVFIPGGEWAKFLGTLEELDSADADTDIAENAVERLRSLILACGQRIDMISELRKEELARFEQLASRMASGIDKRPALGPKLLRRYTDSSLYFANHSVNVVIYSIAVGKKMNLALKERKLLAYAALMHNLGNLFMPKGLLYKPTKLDKREWETIHTHPTKGASLLERLGAPVEVILTALQHHERMDGGGYPRALKGSEIHLFAKITSVADVFDALTSHRPYQGHFIPEVAAQMMRYMEGKFDKQIMSLSVSSLH